MLTEWMSLMKKPKLYEKGTAELWTDEHIAKGMLQAHLCPDEDGATRKYSTVRATVDWIGSIAPAKKYPNLLDLGCGPGIYTERFCRAGYTVSGMDFSKRSIEYAQSSAQKKNLQIRYYYQNYLTLDLSEQFDLITLIYYDFGVLTQKERANLLKKIYAALRPGGLLIFDILMPQSFAGQKESKDWEYLENGFFCAEPHVCFHAFYRYDEHSTILDQYIIATQKNIRSIHNFQHTFTKEEISQDLSAAGFHDKKLYGNIMGADYSSNGKELCVVAQK